MIRALITAALCGLTGCGGCSPWDLDLERMLDQPKLTTYQACEVCPGGTSMMPPPAGTMPRGEPVAPVALLYGREAGHYVDRIPTAVTRGVLERGRNRFDIYCAACHGRLGNGVSKVAENMTLRRPANLLEQPYTEYPPGRIFNTITEGYGLMRSYAGELPTADRWAVVAYVQALQLSQHVDLDALSAHDRSEASRWLK
ncbi:MAG TPA: cytochrome c [Kofleriaceae bacterium]|jgi:mono/diheme cytochrome c family protein|nr:cytochrome c [Kofleriaceae bacterium]